MPLRKEPPTPRSAAAAERLKPSGSSKPSASLVPLQPGQTSLRNQAILTEDEYTSALSSIIKRDFFPNLDRITAENEYLTAVESDDPSRARRALDKLLHLDGHARDTVAVQKEPTSILVASNRLSQQDEWDDTPIASSSRGIFNPTFTPSAAVTSGNDNGAHSDEEKELGSGISTDLDLSLASFQSQYTSEDNASFAQILDRGNQERKRKHAYLFAKEEAAEQRRRRIIQKEREEAEKGRKLAIEANPEHAKVPLIEAEARGGDGKGKQKAENGEEKKQTHPPENFLPVSEAKEEDRSAEVETRIRWKYTTRNALLYGADANVDTLHAGVSTQSTRNDTDPSGKLSTNFSAIRFPSPDPPSDMIGDELASEAWSPTSSRIDSAIRRGRSGSFAFSTSSSTLDTDTPKVNGWGFVTPDSASSAEMITSQAQTSHGRQKYTGLRALKQRRFPSPTSASRRTHLSPAAKALLDRSTKNALTPASRRDTLASPIPPSSSSPSTSRTRVGERSWTPTPFHTQRRHP